MKEYFDFGVKCTHAFSPPKASLIEHKKNPKDRKPSGSLLFKGSRIFSFNSTNLIKNFIKKVEIEKISSFVQPSLFIHLSNYCYGKHIKFIGDE